MKPSLFLPSLLLAVLPGTLHAAPGTVNAVLPKIATGSGVSLSINDLFGGSCAVVGDLDGDGVPELAVGASGDDNGGNSRGAVHLLFLNADASVKSTAKISHGSGGLSLVDFDFFGSSIAPVGDLNGDGVLDLAVGAVGDNTGGGSRGALYVIFLKRDGSVVSFSKIAHGTGGLSFVDGDSFGASCSVVGDLDGDGVTELAVGAISDNTGGDARGAIHLLFLNRTGSLKSTTKIAHGSGDISLNDFDSFGRSCSLVGDLDGDGVPELAVGASGDDAGGIFRGAVHLLFLNANGSVKSSRKITHGSGGLSLANNDSFGISCMSPGDLDGDGTPELVVGALGDDMGGSDRGAVYLVFLNTDGTVKSHTKIAHASGALTLSDDDAFGGSCASLGDLDGDGIPELAVGAVGDDTGGSSSGAVHLIEIGDPPLIVTTLADELDTPSGAQLSLREAIRDADATGQFRTIRFDPSLSGGTFELNIGLGPFAITGQSLRITGQGLPDGLTLSATDLDRLFLLNTATLTVDSLNLVEGNNSGGGGAFLAGAGSRLVLDRVTIASCVGGGGGGGAIQSEGSVVITNCTFLDNSANAGGAILMLGATADLMVSNTTFARNSATGGSDGGGAIFNSFDAATTIRYCTFAGNSSGGTGGGILNDSGTVIVGESLFAGNTAASSANFDNATTNAGGNASVALSQLMTFGDYGGPTPVQPLKPTSAAKNTAFHRAFPATDQRGPGFPRTVGTGRDPGAVEATELSDFQPDSRIGLTAARQIGNNVYNTSGQGQTVNLTLSGRKKTTSFFTVENDGVIRDTIQLRSVAPKKKTLKGSVFRLTGGRTNVSAQVFGTGLALGDLNPGATVAFQADWSRKSATLKAKQTIKITASSEIALKSDVVGAKVGSK